MGYWKLLDTASAEKDFEDDYNVIVQNAFGVGTPPHSNIIQPFALSDGGSFQKTLIQPRVFTLQCATKTTTLDAWHTARKDLFAQLNRDRSGTVSPVTIRYDDGTTTLDIAAYYDGGLEVGTLEKTIEKFAIRFICADPFWKASSTSSTSLNIRSAISNELLIYRDTDGLWNTDGPPNDTDGYDVKFAEKSDGDIVLSANDHIYTYNGTSFTEIGTTNGGDIGALAVDESDNILVGGQFTTINSVTARRIAYYNGSAWSEPATNGFNNTVHDIKLDSNGDYIVCGAFTQDGTGAGTYRGAAKVTASSGAIAEIGNGFDSTVNAVAIDRDDNFYFVGQFQNDGPSGVTLRRIAKWDGSTMSEVDTGLNNPAKAIVYDQNRNVLYIGGQFTGPATGSKSIASLARIANDLFYNLNGKDEYENDTISLDSNGVLFINDNADDRLQSIRGSERVEEDMRITSASGASGVFADTSGRVWVGQPLQAGAYAVGGRTTVNNTGTAEAFPTVAITGPGACYILRNYTTNKSIYFDSLTLLSAEVLTLDLSVGVKTVKSSLRGDMMHKVARASDLATFSLAPGNNNITLWVDDATASATITWTATYWSIDGVT